MLKRMLSVLTLLLPLLLACGVAQAQVTTATLYGNVADASGATVPGATVTLTNDQTGAAAQAQTDASGEFTFSFLPVGEYTLKVVAQGFKTLLKRGIKLESGQRLRLDSALETGGVSDTVTVTAEQPLVNTVSAEQRDAIGTAEVRELPTFRRDWTGLLRTVAGVDIGTPGNTGGVSLNGLPASAINFTIDGTNASENPEVSSLSQFGNFNIIKGLSLEAISEVSVTRGIAPAEIANTLSGNINLISRSGTNEYHGSLFHNYQGTVLNARPAFATNPATRPPVVFNQFGGSFGGPVIRNRLFFFGVYEGYRERNFSLLNTNVATKEFRERAIAAVPAYKAFFDTQPLPNQPYAAGANQGLFIGAKSRGANDDHVTARGDYNLNDRNLVNLRYTRSRPDSITPRASVNTRTFEGKGDAATLNYITTRASWSGETRLGFRRNDVQREDVLYALGVAGLRINDNSAANRISIQDDGETFLTRGKSYSVEEILAKTVGRHTMKFGGIFQRQTQTRANVESPSIRYTSVADFLTNTPSAAQYTFGLEAYELRKVTLGFFAQDDFKLHSRLTLNLGLRYDYFTVPEERDGRFFNRETMFGPERPPDSVWDADFINFSPRVGLAWAVDSSSRTVVRAGFGVFHSQPGVLVGPVTPVNKTDLDRFTFSRAEVLSLRAQGQDVAYGRTNAQVLSIVRTKLAPPRPGTIDVNNPTPYSMQYMLGVQRQLTGTTALEVAYVGNVGRRLSFGQTLNLPDRVTGVRPNPAFNQFRYRNSADSSSYNSLQATLRQRLVQGLSLEANYVYSKNLSYQYADLQIGATAAEPNEPLNLALERGPAPNDVRHRFVTNFMYELPAARWLGAQSRWAELLLGGYQVAGVVRAQTGDAINLTQSTAFPGERVDYVGGDFYVSDAGGTLGYLNPAAFRAVPRNAASGRAVRPGTLGRHALRAPGFVTTDLALSKNFQLTERVRLQIRGDLFNAFNQTNLVGVQTNITAGNFGQLTSAQENRRVQLNARLTF
jgi:hypothetical protein